MPQILQARRISPAPLNNLPDKGVVGAAIQATSWPGNDPGCDLLLLTDSAVAGHETMGDWSSASCRATIPSDPKARISDLHGRPDALALHVCRARAPVKDCRRWRSSHCASIPVAPGPRYPRHFHVIRLLLA